MTDLRFRVHNSTIAGLSSAQIWSLENRPIYGCAVTVSSIEYVFVTGTSHCQECQEQLDIPLRNVDDPRNN